MDEKYLRVKELLKENGQEQLLNNFEKLDINKKNKLLDEILTINFEQIKKLYMNTKKAVSFNEMKLEPIPYVEKDKLSLEERARYEKIGEDIIRKGQYAVVTMAGGQGTRLGHNGPKGSFDLGLESHKSLFEILSDTLKESFEKYGDYIPWYIMTSEENNQDTIEFFEKHNYFGYEKGKIKFFKQGELPVLNEDGKILLNKDGLINKAADGHGGIFVAMRRNAVIYDMRARGIKWAFIGGVDNVLVKMVDPLLVGLAEDAKVLAAGKSVVKAYPEERVGVFCKKNGKPSVIEYTEISKELAEQRTEDGELQYGESHILCNLFNIEAIDEISKDKLPYHCAHKKIPYMNNNGEVINPETPNAYKFEAFLFDAFESLDDMVIMRVKREEEFAPVKNAEGVDSPETARKLYKEYHNL